MSQKILVFFALGIFSITACHKKAVPEKSTVVVTKPDTARSSGSTVTKPKTPPAAVPKVIVVEDSKATKTFDGRYYYDLMGHRYWKNNIDGKYYLYNKSMNNDPAFKKQP